MSMAGKIYGIVVLLILIATRGWPRQPVGNGGKMERLMILTGRRENFGEFAYATSSG